MIRQLIKLRRRRVLLDIDTQKDFFIADGKCCIRNHRRVLMNIRRTIAWARKKKIRVISTATNYPQDMHDRHSFCKEGTTGSQRIGYTVRDSFIKYDADGYSDLNRSIFKEYHQVILEKKTADPFDEPRIERMLSELAVDEIIIMGAITEGAILKAVLGLLQRGKRVTVFTDAIGSIDKNAAEMALRKMEAKGARLVEAKTIVGVSKLNKVGVCKCDRCQGKMHKATLVH